MRILQPPSLIPPKTAKVAQNSATSEKIFFKSALKSKCLDWTGGGDKKREMKDEEAVASMFGIEEAL